MKVLVSTPGLTAPAGGGRGDTKEEWRSQSQDHIHSGALLTLQEFKILTFPGQRCQDSRVAEPQNSKIATEGFRVF